MIKIDIQTKRDLCRARPIISLTAHLLGIYRSIVHTVEYNEAVSSVSLGGSFSYKFHNLIDRFPSDGDISIISNYKTRKDIYYFWKDLELEDFGNAQVLSSSDLEEFTEEPDSENDTTNSNNSLTISTLGGLYVDLLFKDVFEQDETFDELLGITEPIQPLVYVDAETFVKRIVPDVTDEELKLIWGFVKKNYIVPIQHPYFGLFEKYRYTLKVIKSTKTDGYKLSKHYRDICNIIPKVFGDEALVNVQNSFSKYLEEIVCADAK